MHKNIVINWHLLEPCQLKCTYCYAEWSKSNLPLIFRDEDKSKQLIREIAKLDNDGTLRLSFAGGEPLLDKKITQKIRWASEENLQTSIITNGDFLSKALKKEDLSRLQMLGVSIDSFNNKENILIGRATSSGRVPDYIEIARYLELAREINPKIKIKINTVVNRFNWQNNLSQYIEEIKPDKWKVLRVLPATSRSELQTITDEQFQKFKFTHKHLPYVRFEDNPSMINSYLMIDPYGRFFFNQEKKQRYGYSESIIEVGIQEALNQIKFDEKKFKARYIGE